MTPSATQPHWQGFYRRRKADQWQRLAESADYGDTWSALLTATRQLPPGELLVSMGDPNAAARPRRCY